MVEGCCGGKYKARQIADVMCPTTSAIEQLNQEELVVLNFSSFGICLRDAWIDGEKHLQLPPGQTRLAMVDMDVAKR